MSTRPEPAADASDGAVKAGHAANFDRLNEQLADTPFDRHVRFFNFGYVPLEGQQPVGPTLGGRFPNRESAQLLFEVVGDADLTGATVAEVGSGRGGNLWLLEKYYGTRYVVGIDIAWRSVQFASRAQPHDRAAFMQGDAEAVPLADASVDAIVNIETSCTYPRIEAFYREVARCVRPGGWFLYTDLIESTMCDPVVEALTTLGFDLVERRVISPNVLASREQRAGRQLLAFGDTGGDAGWDEYVGLDGTRLHEYLRGGQMTYLLLRFRRRADDRPPPGGDLFTPEQQALLRAGAQDGVDILTIEPGPS